MKKHAEQFKKELIAVIHKIARDRDLLEDFIHDILTPREFENLGVRWQIAKRLSKGEHQESIAGELHTGIATVTRGSREMRKQDGGFRRALRVIK